MTPHPPRFVVILSSSAVLFAVGGSALAQAETGKTPIAALACPCPSCGGDPLLTGKPKTETKKPVTKPKELTHIDQLKKAFNKDAGVPRLVLLLSTTCPVCVEAAQRVQEEILRKHPQAKLKLYVVWEQMLPTDKLRRTREDLITDVRAVHFKDTNRISGKWFSQNMKDCPSLGKIAWDAFYLYGADAKWDKTPTPTLACGTPVVKDWKSLAKAISPLLKP